MIRPHVPLSARYVDYGKVFVPNGALDFSTLAYSDSEVASYGPHLFNRGLVFPEGSPFANQIGSVSAALLMFEGGYLFTLVQRRREGELSRDPRTDRPFNQVRFVILTREMIEGAFAARAGLYTGLARGAYEPGAKVWLKDYESGGDQRLWSPALERLDPTAPNVDAIHFVTNALVSASQRAVGAGGAGLVSTPQPISVPLPGQDLVEKLQLIEAVQYWAFPRLGIISWALDYVSVQNVHLRLFDLPANAPAPLPQERVFLPGPIEGRFADDYYTPISTLEHEALFDPGLPSLMALNISTATAVELHKVEKQAQPLTGEAALRLYPELARLGDRRFNWLRRVPRDDMLALLRQPDLPVELRLDLLQVALDADHGLLWLYAPAHLAVPRASRTDERLRTLLRTSLSKSPETALNLVQPEDQAELFFELLMARRVPPVNKHQGTTTAPLILATGQSVLDLLLLQRRGPELAQAMKNAAPHDTTLFTDALRIMDLAADLPGLLWLWRSAGQGEPKNFHALLERAVQPSWYSALARDAATWRELLEAGRALVTDPGKPEAANAGSLLHALPRELVPFVWQASLHVANHDAAFGEWWLYNEAVALPEQLPDLWQALQRLPAGALLSAGPGLNFLLGRSKGLSLLRACTPPGYHQTNEALFGTVLTAWREAGFRSLAGDLVLATEDVQILLAHLPGSNDVLAAVVKSPAQAAAIGGLTAAQALHWARTASGPLRDPYRDGKRDLLFERLMELPALDEALLWHLLVDDDGSDGTLLGWPAYAALAMRSRDRLDALQIRDGAKLRDYLGTAIQLQNKAVAAVFQEHGIDIRTVLMRLSDDPANVRGLGGDMLPLAVFHLQETSPALKARSAVLLRAALEQPDAATHLAELPDKVLQYLREHFCDETETRVAAGHWIDAELSRRTNAYKLEALLKPPPRPRSASPTHTEHPVTQAEAAASPRPVPSVGRTPARVPKRRASATPPPPPPPPPLADGAEAVEATMTPLVGELALPTTASKKQDTAVWLWVAIVTIVVVILAVLIGAVVWIQGLQAEASALLRAVWHSFPSG